MSVMTSGLETMGAGRDGAASRSKYPDQQRGGASQPVTNASPSDPETDSVTADESSRLQILIRIGNSDDSLSQSEWAQFIAEVREIISRFADDITMEAFSIPDAPWQHGGWAFMISADDFIPMRRAISGACGMFRQTSTVMNVLSDNDTILPRYLTKAQLEADLELDNDPFGQRIGAKNVYACDVCMGRIVVVHLDNGVTPMTLGCKAEGCKGTMYSSGYRRAAQTEIPNFVWYRPQSDQGRFDPDPDVHEHIVRGGLLLRPMASDETIPG